MLILSRKPGDAIPLGDSIQIKVLEITGTRVRLGLSAPESVRIQRAECATPETPGDEDMLLLDGPEALL